MITKLKNSVSNRVVAGAVGVTMALAILGTAGFAQAASLTSAQVSAIVSLLQSFGADSATIANVQAALGGQATTGTTGGTTTGGASVCPTPWTRSLTVGSTGMDVHNLQVFLNANGAMVAAMGAGSPGMETSYFGPATKAAVASYQASHGIAPAAGYFGPITMAAVNAACMTAPTGTTGGTTTGGTTTTGGSTSLSGGEGSLDNFKIVGATNTTMNAADTQTVYGFEFKAGGSDLQVNRVDFDAYQSGTTGTSPSTRPWAIFQTAKLMNGSNTIATVDATNMNNWSQDGTATNGNTIYRLRFDGLNDIVKMGSTADYYLVLTTQNAISDTNVGGAGDTATWTVNLVGQGVRATDAMGLQEYSSSSAQSTATVVVANSTTGSMIVSTDSANPPAASIQANSSASTNGVVLTSFDLQAKNADMNVYQIPATVATTSTTANNLVRSFKLYQGTNLIDTETIAAGASNNFTFKNLNITIPSGTTQNFTVQADISPVGVGTSNPEGSAVGVSIGTNGSWDVTNSAGSQQVTPTGSVTGNVQTFYTTGIAVANPTTNTSVQTLGNTTQQQGTFTFTFDVTAFGQDIYVGTTTNAFTATLNDGSGVSTTTTASSITSTNASRSANNNYVVHSGETKSFTVSLTKTGQGGYVYAKLSALNYGTADTFSGVTASSTNAFGSQGTNYQTQQIYLND